MPDRPTNEEIVEVVSNLMDIAYEPTNEEESQSVGGRLARAHSLIERLEGRQAPEPVEYGDEVIALCGSHRGERMSVSGINRDDPYQPVLVLERRDGSRYYVPWLGSASPVRKVHRPDT